MDNVDDVKHQRDHEYISKLIGEYFSQKLFSLIHEIFVRQEDKDSVLEDNDFDDLDNEQQNYDEDDPDG